MQNKAIILLGRYPTPGKVKTRLASEIGSEKAAEVYKRITEDLVRKITTSKDNDLYFYAADVEDVSKIQKWLGDSIKVAAPKSKDIEQNLKTAFVELFSSGYKKVISIASDVPSLDQKIIAKAFDLLEINDVVIGPDTDGGIYLFGCKKSYNELFENESRNKNTIFDETLDKLKNEKVVVLERLVDVDTKDDLDKYVNI